MKELFKDEPKKVVNVTCKYIISCAGSFSFTAELLRQVNQMFPGKEICFEDFDKFLKRFGPFENCLSKVLAVQS